MIRSGSDEERSPKYAHIERERRWLVDPARLPDMSDLPFAAIEDCYIQGTRVRLRRMSDSATGTCALKLTKKYEAADPLARPIVTAYLSDSEFEVFAALPGLSLAKQRYSLSVDGAAFSVDVFRGPLAPLILAEIEWSDDTGLNALQAPIWAIREVSNDPRYQGAALAASGAPKDRPWPRS